MAYPAENGQTTISHRFAVMSNADDLTAAALAQALMDEYYENPSRRRSSMRALFNRSARHYDKVNQIFSLGSGAWYRRSCLRRAGVRPGVKVVDVAVGTGLLAREALRLTGERASVIGVDISEAMLEIAQCHLAISLVQASAEALPLAPDIADFVTMGFALRHVADLKLVFSEALRILRPGGSIIVLEISAPRNRLYRAAAAAFIGFMVPLLALLMTRDARARALMQYHWRTILRYMPTDAVLRVMVECGFDKVTCASDFDLFHCYKGTKPAIEVE